MIGNHRARRLLVAVAIGTVAHTGLAQSTKRPMSLNDIMAMKNVGAPAISPDGKLVVYTVNAWEHPNAKGDTALGDKHDMRSHIWLVASDGSAPARQLTFSERGESQPAWSPDGSMIAFVSARGAAAAGEDGPTPQVHVLRLVGGEAEKITSVRDGVGAFAWSPDGRTIAFLSTDSLTRAVEAQRKRRDDPQVYEGDQRLSHLWVVDVATKKERELVHSTRFTIRGAPDWSSDSRRFTMLTVPSTLTRDERRTAYIVDAATGSMKEIEAGGEVQQTPKWSPDAATLAVLVLAQSHKPHGDSMMERELRNEHLVLYDVASGKARDVSSPNFDNSPGAPIWSRDGRGIYFTAGDRVWSSVYHFDVASGAYHKLTNHELVRGLSFSRDGSRVAMLIESGEAPNDIYVGDASFAKPTQLTRANPQLDGIALGRTEVMTWKSTDGQEVEGVLLLPVGYQQGQRVPMLVEPHGGPTGAHSAGFKANWGSPGQFWAGKGWATFYPNPRGSTGYGEKFMRGNIPDWGGGDYRDIMTGVDAVIARGIADGDKLAVAGWSYGGYMTNWIVTQTTRFKAARTGAGLTDLESMYGTTDIPGYIGTFFFNNPTKANLALYRERSPITYIDRVTTPLLILHGGIDERVPIGQAMEMFRGLKDQGKTVELVFYPREHHGFTEYYHQLDKMRREYDWISKYTLGPKTVSSR